MTISAQPDFAVIGGGLCGRLVAWQLAGDGHRVALYERGDVSGSQAAAWVAAAMLAPLAEAASAELLITRLGAASLETWPTLLDQLPERVFFQRNGSLIVWHHSDRAEAPLFERRLRANAPAELLDGGLVALAGAQVGAAEPALGGRFNQGWLLPHEGQLDNRQLLAALAAGLAARGVETHWNTSVDDNALPAARITIDCRGLGAKPVMPTLRGIRGEVARVHAPGIGLTRPVRLLHPRYPLYIAPKENDLYVIGATEVEGEDMSPVSVRSALELLSAAFSVHPAFGEARILELNSQCRPTLPDHRPALMWDGASTLRVNGLYRHGYMIVPEVAGEAVRFASALLDGRVADEDAFADWRNNARWRELFQLDRGHIRGDARPAATLNV
ncbi:putative thiamine biosynthesis oxidoreductase ThiO [Paraburkholderia piptadeniae]|uniref:Thiamine biosynthesis oxidoreductase ThiO n=1 Tax=Paraburkholderia piptadeniae TaxID=1701573 RepID=A0A1N7SCW0_9BURK|nr:FAD-dependent oxidoreductase [Paraburkholderia piptadeniae]SIT44808.1 putative thiamine biosynthesis oxidoreductase ThiO [Paraburkholderia piptadeniae]